MSKYIDADAFKSKLGEALCDQETGDIGKLLNMILTECIDELPAADVVSREFVNQIKWERDTAIQQLNELGYEFGERRTDE